MNFFKSLFSSTPQEQARSHVQKYISSVGVNTKSQALPLTFQYQLTTSFSNCQSPSLFMHELIAQLQTTKNVSSTVKLFTIIHNAIYERDYQKDELQSLQQMPTIMITDVEQSKWFGEFCISYSSYLQKLPSICDILKRAKTGNLSQTPPSSFLIEVFRIINQISLLFPSICTLTNVIGRYYATSYPQFPQFYRMLNKEITIVYSYLKLVIDQILLTYRDLDVQQLKGFMKTMPQIELTCDKIEDLLLNKYFKGKAIKAKIYLREEKVQELCYYLEYQLQGKNLMQQQGETLSTDIRRENVQISDNDNDQ